STWRGSSALKPLRRIAAIAISRHDSRLPASPLLPKKAPTRSLMKFHADSASVFSIAPGSLPIRPGPPHEPILSIALSHRPLTIAPRLNPPPPPAPPEINSPKIASIVYWLGKYE